MSVWNSIGPWFLRHKRSLIQGTFILVGTYFLAKTINLFVAHFLLPIEIPSSARPSGPSNAQATVHQISIQQILSRNLFDSEVKTRVIDKLPSLSQSDEIVPTTLAAELLGTLVFRNARFSVALIHDKSSKEAGYYGVGERFLSARVMKIERFRVIFENQGRLESLDIKDAVSQLTKSMSTPRSGFEIDPEPGRQEDLGLEEIGPNRYAVPKATVDDVLKNFSQVLTQARMVPHIVEGQTDGFRVFQIKSGSIYETLGMKNDDIIKRVNGVDLDSFEKATGLFTALRNEKTISIDIVRNGTRINYTYEIR